MKTIFRTAALVLLGLFTLVPRTGLAQDADADGMPDAWEAGYPCLYPSLPDGLLNPDGDAYDNYTEYVNQTDPCSILFHIADSAGPELGVSAAFDGSRFLAGISSGSTIHSQLFAPTGSRVGGAIPLGAGQDFTMVAFDGTNYLVAWADKSLLTDAQIFGQLITPAGDTLGPAFPITGFLDIDSKLAGLAFGSGKYLAIWQDGRSSQGDDIYGQMVSTAGAPVGSEIPIATADGDDREASVAFDGTNFLAIFATGRRPGSHNSPDIYGQFVAPSGSLGGSNFVISQNDLPSDNPTALAYISAGSCYLALWSDQLNGDTSWDIYGRKISPAGALVSSTLLFAGGPGSQFFPSLVHDGTGTLVAWNDLNNWDVMGRYYQSGAPVGPVFPIWADNGNQLGAVTAFSDGRYLALVNSDVWVPPGGEGRWNFGDVFGRFITPPVAGDTVAPAPPANLTARESGDLEIELAWDVPADTDVAGYKIYAGTYLVATVSPNHYRVNPPDPNTEYCFTVQAFDRMGNLSAPSNQACAINRLALRVGNVDSDLGANIVQAGRPAMVEVKNALPSPVSMVVEFRNLPSGAWLAADSVQSILSEHGVLTCITPAGLSAGSAEVRVTLDGRVSRTTSVSVTSGVWTPGPYQVSGRVVNSGQGVAGAWLVAMVPNPNHSSDGNLLSNQAVTNPQGYFSLMLQAGNYEIYTGVDGGRLVDGRAVLTVAGNTTLPDIAMANGVIYSGHVVDSENHNLFLGGGSIRVGTNDEDSNESPVFVDGSFRVVLPPGGPYGYQAELDPVLMYPQAQGMIGTINSDLTNQVIQMIKGKPFELDVVNEDHDPIPGAHVRLEADDWEINGEADEHGHVLLPVSGGTVELALVNDDYLHQPYVNGRIWDLGIPDEGLNLGTITMWKGALVTGHLRNSVGDPIWGHLDFENNNPPPESPFDMVGTCTDTNPDGSLVGRAFPGQNRFNLNFEDFNNKNGTAYLNIEMNLTIAGDTDLGTIVVSAGARLTGSVEDLNGNPVTGVEVNCENNLIPDYPHANIDGPGNDFALVLHPGEDYECSVYDRSTDSWTDFPDNPVNCTADCNVGVIHLPYDTDYDQDGLSNVDEINVYFTNPYDPDTDGDGLNDGDEIARNTDPLIADSDGDGWSDGVEVHRGTDPLSTASHPGPIGPQQLINYQGRLMGNASQPVNGPVPMTFGIYPGDTAATPLWSESQTVTVTMGIYNVLLGSVNPIDLAAFATTDSPSFYLQVSANGETLAPRSRLSFVPFSMFASRLFNGRLEMDGRTLIVNPAASVLTLHVNFNQAFTASPKVVVSPPSSTLQGQSFVATEVKNITSSGFDVVFKSLTGAAASGSASFTYFAFGQ